MTTNSTIIGPEILAFQREVIDKTLALKHDIAKGHLQNIRSQQRFERIMETFGSMSQFTILYILPAGLSGWIGYKIMLLGKAAKLIMVKCIMLIPHLIYELFLKIYGIVMMLCNISLFGYFNFWSKTNTTQYTIVDAPTNSTMSYFETKLNSVDSELENISKHTLDVLVTFLVVGLYLFIMIFMHVLVKWDEIRKFQLGWTHIIVETKERNQTSKYEIEQMARMLSLQGQSPVLHPVLQGQSPSPSLVQMNAITNVEPDVEPNIEPNVEPNVEPNDVEPNDVEPNDVFLTSESSESNNSDPDLESENSEESEPYAPTPPLTRLRQRRVNQQHENQTL